LVDLLKANDETRLVAINPTREGLGGLGEEEVIDFTDNPSIEASSSSSSSSKKAPLIINRVIDNGETLKLTSGFNGVSIYLRYKDNPKYPRIKEEEEKSGAKSGAKKAGRPKSDVITIPEIIVLFSFTNDVGDFRQVPSFKGSNNIYNIIASHLDVPKEAMMKFFKLDPQANIVQGIGKERLLNKFLELGVKPSTTQGYLVGYEGKKAIVGEGLTHEKKDKKVKFGDIVIMPNKLFYDNILSVSRPDGIKLNGFKNRHVSDDFVVCVIKILQGRDDFNTDLSKLSSTEKVLLDNLLKIANLHKKVITGTGKDSIEKLKKELEILEGEIQAGNNNESLKQKLHDILHKLAYFKVISLSQANKHYKEYVKNFF
jgi:hypothetical protein